MRDEDRWRGRYWLLVVALLSTSAACRYEGALGVVGRAYEWRNAGPADSGYILLDRIDEIPPAGLTAVASAEVLVEPWLPSARPRESLSKALRVVSDAHGYFKGAMITRGGQFDATVTVRCAGFRAVERVFRHDVLRHRMIVVLVREPAAP